MSRHVLLIRHAKASLQNVENGTLAPLSENGKVVQKEMNNYLKARKIIPTQIWHSPILRAAQTAEIMGEDFGLKPQPELSLSEYLDEYDILDKLKLVPDGSTIFLVSHGPQIMKLTRFFLDSSPLKMPLQNSACLLIDFPDLVEAGKGHFVRHIDYQDAMMNKGIKF